MQSESVRFVENLWESVDRSGTRPASRADLLTVLSNLQYILIRASLNETVHEVQISDVSMDTAVEQQTGQRVVDDVEICMCPEGYRGTSCEVSISNFLICASYFTCGVCTLPTGITLLKSRTRNKIRKINFVLSAESTKIYLNNICIV